MPEPRFVELVRVSGSSQAERDTPADQRRALDALRRTRPGILVERIEEGAAGLSGALPLDQRPDLQRLFVLAGSKAFDEVRVRHIDRLTRHPDPRERYAIFGAVADAGAVIVDAGNHVIDPASEMGELDFAFQTIVAARERRRIFERTYSAKVRLAQQGKLQGRPPYARTWNKVAGTWGTDPERLKVYRRIYRDVLAGKSLNQIAKDLNAEKIPTVGAALRGQLHSEAWSAGHVSRLVKHRSAIGELTTNGVALTCPPVVDLEAWKRAQLAIKNSRAGRPATGLLPALLRGRAVCGLCGSTMWVKQGGRRALRYLYYVCRSYQTARNEGCQKWHRVEEVDGVAWDELLVWLARNVVPRSKAGPDSKELVKSAEAKLAELAKEEDRLLRVARRASPEAAERALTELQGEMEQARRSLERARLIPDRQPEVETVKRAALLRRAKRAVLAERRAMVLAVLLPGGVAIWPDGRIEIR
jgi:DNA invertase Pin-like site-specific DNA recombinase